MPTPNPFPLEIVNKVNSPELLAFLQQFGHDKYADATDINKILQALQFIYENLGGSAISDLTKFTVRPTIDISGTAVLVSDDGEWLINGVSYAQTEGASFSFSLNDEGNERFVLIIAGTDGNYNTVEGEQSATNPAAPTLPLNTLLVSILLITDSTITEIPLSAIADLIDPEGDNQLVIGPNGKLYINVAAGSVPDATESVKGKAQIATEAETISGTNDTKFITALKLKAVADSIINYFTTSRIKTLLGQASSSVDGWLSSTDWNIFNNKQNALGYTPENLANKGVANGYVPLNSSVKIDTTYLPDSILGQLLYGGVVDASTTIATLTNNAKSKLGTGSSTITLTNNTTAITGYSANEGIYYIATVAGTFASISFEVGDWLVSIGSAWKKVDNTDAISSFNGRTGAITLISSDVLPLLLSGLSAASGTFTSSDTILTAFGKIKYLIDNISTLYQAALTSTNLGTLINGFTSKTTPVGDDAFLISNSADSNKAYTVSYTNLSATLKAYFDTIYATPTLIVKRILNSTVETSLLTGTTSEVLIYSAPVIAGGSFASDDYFNFQAVFRKQPGNSIGCTYRVYISNTNNFATASLLATWTSPRFNTVFERRNIYFKADNTINSTIPATTSTQTDLTNTDAALTSISLNPANDIYFFVSAQLGVGTDNVKMTAIKIFN